MSEIIRNPQRTLIRLVGLNIALDVLSIPLWIAVLLTSTSASLNTLTVTTTVAIVDATIAAAAFGVAFFGIVGSKNWGVYLAAAITLGQRVVGAFIFSLNGAMVIEVVWSLLIIYFAYKVLQLHKSAALESKAAAQT